jgi:transmembrane sensor
VTKTDFEFVNQPMPEVFEKLRRIYGIDIIYDEAVLKDCYVDVTLSNEPFFTKLDILCKTIGATYQNADGRITVISQGCH